MGVLFQAKSGYVPDYYKQKAQAEKEAGRKLSNTEFEENYLQTKGGSSLADTGTSVFDPVLCELSYAWFSTEGDRIIDPFAGGSVRGVVASRMNRKYTGVELRAEQVAANIEQGKTICETCPTWITGDSSHIDELVKEDGFDFMFTCPPYADLEVYSDDPADISNMPWEDFLSTYETILNKTVKKLADDRFACIVIGDVRDGGGFYRNLPGKTIEIMERAGARYYNEAILVTPAGSLPIRVGKQFQKSRKLGKTHQNVLVFCKGDPRKATSRLGDVDLPDLEEDETFGVF